MLHVSNSDIMIFKTFNYCFSSATHKVSKTGSHVYRNIFGTANGRTIVMLYNSARLGPSCGLKSTELLTSGSAEKINRKHKHFLIGYSCFCWEKDNGIGLVGQVISLISILLGCLYLYIKLPLCFQSSCGMSYHLPIDFFILK